MTTTKNLPTEELLAIDEIQGNSLAGFNKDFQRFLFLKIHDRAIAKQWLRSVIPNIASVREVLTFNRMFRALRERRGEDPPGFVATWINIAFTAQGLKALTSEAEVKKFQDTPFQIGLTPSRAALIGDPQDPTSPGHPKNWVVGGPTHYPDVVLILASDDPVHLSSIVGQIKADLQALPQPSGGSAQSALELLYDQAGMTRPDKPGHEHFGFRDGISQPGIRGRVSKAGHDFLTPRLIDPTDDRAALFAKPGQPLIWAGQFVLGYQQQKHDDPIVPLPAAKLTPQWAKNGSYLVFRRLNQDVPKFWQFVQMKAAELAQKPGFSGMTAEHLATLFVGRWQSGAPLMRSPTVDNPDLAKDSLANNHFSYVSPTQPIPLVPGSEYQGDRFPQAPSDFEGLVCPHIAHIRKVNPRDAATDTGGGNDTLTRLILRRGIPFGTPIQDPLHPTPAELKEERGLLFVSYQASIEDQFEFLMQRWVNQSKVPSPGGGPDPIIGQQEKSGSRQRQVTLKTIDGVSEVIDLMNEWVTPTGGGYFFAPSISALRDVLAK